VLAVTENKKEDDNSGGWTSYPPLSAFASSAVPGWHTTISGPSHVIVGDLTATGWYPLGGTITVHFWVE
jgi:heme/copper-type cytochrome/quinol oxidase subunit 1